MNLFARCTTLRNAGRAPIYAQRCSEVIPRFLGSGRYHGVASLTTCPLSALSFQTPLHPGTSTAYPNRFFASRSGRPRRNSALEAVKQAGMAHLEQTTQDVATKTRDPLIVSEESDSPSVNQLREANRIHRVLNDCLEDFSRKNSSFSIRGETIAIMEVEVSPDLRHARAYWTLPISLIEFPEKVRLEAKRRMQIILEKHGGRLQTLVHAKLRFYYPPKIRFVQADDDILTHAFKDLL
mmetsp:Transcript_11433/g.33705  ORF Transcript_11433/g.33705 Transcript_11433/m.33705 type:complete len:238 (+) Transcript_11433:137-850(+)